MEKPHWMVDHEEEDARRFDELGDDLREIKNLLRPIAETYGAASLLGKWLMAGLVFLSVLFGVVYSIKALFIK